MTRQTGSFAKRSSFRQVKCLQYFVCIEALQQRTTALSVNATTTVTRRTLCAVRLISRKALYKCSFPTIRMCQGGITNLRTEGKLFSVLRGTDDIPTACIIDSTQPFQNLFEEDAACDMAAGYAVLHMEGEDEAAVRARASPSRPSRPPYHGLPHREPGSASLRNVCCLPGYPIICDSLGQRASVSLSMQLYQSAWLRTQMNVFGFRFGKTDFDDDDILMPLRQCCVIRPSTLGLLLNYYKGPKSLTQALHE